MTAQASEATVTTSSVLQGDEALAYVKGLEARQDFITTLGAKQGLWNQAISTTQVGYNMAKAWGIPVTTTVTTPVYQDLGNGWTVALVPIYDTVTIDMNGNSSMLGYGVDTYIVDSISGYQMNISEQLMSWETYTSLRDAYGMNSYYWEVATPATGTRDTDYTVYFRLIGKSSTKIADNVYSEVTLGYFMYPSDMTGLTLVVPTISTTVNSNARVNQGEAFYTNSAYVTNSTFFKIN